MSSSKNTDVERKIVVADYAGFCPGVEAAIGKTFRVLEKAFEINARVVYENDTVNQPWVVKRLQHLGLRKYDEKRDESKSIFVVSAHGISQADYHRIRKNTHDIVDTTCCFVQWLQREVVRHSKEGYRILLFGKKDHPEVKGVVGQIDEPVIVVETVEEARKIKDTGPTAIFSQTTLSRSRFEAIVAACRIENLKVVYSLCATVQNRVNAACELAQSVDLMVVVGGEKSSNTRAIVQSLEERNHLVLFVEDETCLRPAMFSGVSKVGVTAGASTPRELIDLVVARIRQFD